MKLWLDDRRQAPEGFEPARSVNEAIGLVESAERAGEEIELCDLDHDLGIYEAEGGNGMDFLYWLIERESWYPVRVHSSDVAACEEMETLIEGLWE